MISAKGLLCYEIDPVPKYRFLRDVLGLSSDTPLLIDAKKEVLGTKWVKEILEQQQADGSFGYFHSLSMPDKYPVTTEQALRRLNILGLDYSDLCIKNTVSYMEKFLEGELDLPDRKEKQCDWTTFTHLITAAQIRKFNPLSDPAAKIAYKWRNIIEYAFSDIEFNQRKYNEAYETVFLKKPRGGRLVDFVSFYPLTLLHGILSNETESRMLDYVIWHSEGIYYIYESDLSTLPSEFSSKQANRYLNALELLSVYSCSKEKLGFASNWIIENCSNDGLWDMGASVKDGVSYPLSYSWRNPVDRKIDCTVRIMSILKKLQAIE